MAMTIRELPAILLMDVCKSFGTGEGRVDALKNINLEIARGEFLALCGPSGSGKSTLLNILSGIDKPTSGSTLFLDKSLNELDEGQLSTLRGRHLGFIFQFFNLIPVLSAFDNVCYPLILNGRYGRKEARERTQHTLESVGIGALGNRTPGQLSGGQQQRVAIARALAHDPQVVVADEPTGNLDQATGEVILELMMKINQETRTTFIVSTHSAQLRDRARRVIEIKDGEIVHDVSK